MFKAEIAHKSIKYQNNSLNFVTTNKQDTVQQQQKSLGIQQVNFGI